MEKYIEKYGVKLQIGTAVAVVLAIIYWVFIGAARLTVIENELTNCNNQSIGNKAIIIELQADTQSTEIALAEIKVKLSNIEVTLAEIRQDLKTK